MKPARRTHTTLLLSAALTMSLLWWGCTDDITGPEDSPVEAQAERMKAAPTELSATELGQMTVEEIMATISPPGDAGSASGGSEQEACEKACRAAFNAAVHAAHQTLEREKETLNENHKRAVNHAEERRDMQLKEAEDLRDEETKVSNTRLKDGLAACGGGPVGFICKRLVRIVHEERRIAIRNSFEAKKKEIIASAREERKTLDELKERTSKRITNEKGQAVLAALVERAECVAACASGED